MQRPNIALCMIVKNEAHNLSRILQSVRGCFDEIHITDTGSDDGTVDFLNKINELIAAGDTSWTGIPKINIHHFEWVNDFAAARSYSFSHAKTDYLFWMDGDDELSSSANFIQWRDSVMHSAHYWVAVYNYGYNPDGSVGCRFIRERVIKNNFGFQWKYFVHEGIVQTEPRKYWPQRVSSWTINHRRSNEDMTADKLRNIRLFEAHDYATLDPRMLYYYGKELCENGYPDKAGKPLMDALGTGKLDQHDMLLAIQYASQSAFACKAFEQAGRIAMAGIQAMPHRAEFWCLYGDACQAQGKISEAIHAWNVALTCHPDDLGGVIVLADSAYGEFPHIQLAAANLNIGNLIKAKESIDWLVKNKHPRADEFKNSLAYLENLSTVRQNLQKVDDIIISCPPGGAVTDWDENTLEAKGHGGSETAAIEVAKWLKANTNRKVKIFQTRAKYEVMPSGVEYHPISELQGYLHAVEPHGHIAWRHSARLTNAKSYVWCHDLQCPGAENVQNYDKIVALSGFHKHYLRETNGVPDDKIVLGFNGINPNDFTEVYEKDPLKVVFSSSPDRGLAQTVDIVKKAREISGLDIKLHCFYGFENMRKAGQGEWADSIEKKITDNDFVIAHGMVTKKELMRHFKEAGVWLYPADFIETYCITAIESLCAGTWGIVRSMGALPYTLEKAIKHGMVQITDVEVTDEASTGLWANMLCEAILEKKWEQVKVDPQDLSWAKVGEFFKEQMAL